VCVAAVVLLTTLWETRSAKALENKACDSVAEQVAFLLEQATDPNILGRTWGGWEPWV
jgi:hypothetical protein